MSQVTVTVFFRAAYTNSSWNLRTWSCGMSIELQDLIQVILTWANNHEAAGTIHVMGSFELEDYLNYLRDLSADLQNGDKSSFGLDFSQVQDWSSLMVFGQILEGIVNEANKNDYEVRCSVTFTERVRNSDLLFSSKRKRDDETPLEGSCEVNRDSLLPRRIVTAKRIR